MFRLTVSLYLAFIVACGPAMCCCTLQHWLPGLGAGHCCGHQASPLVAKEVPTPIHQQHAGHHHHPADKHDGCHSHRHCVAASTNESAPVVPSGSQSKPAQPHSDDCDCGLHRATMYSSSAVDSTPVAVADAGGYLVLSFNAIVTPDAFTFTHRQTQHFRPADLSGREILRAYSRLLC